jgi:hypothetical protein
MPGSSPNSIVVCPLGTTSASLNNGSASRTLLPTMPPPISRFFKLAFSLRKSGSKNARLLARKEVTRARSADLRTRMERKRSPRTNASSQDVAAQDTTCNSVTFSRGYEHNDDPGYDTAGVPNVHPITRAVTNLRNRLRDRAPRLGLQRQHV